MLYRITLLVDDNVVDEHHGSARFNAWQTIERTANHIKSVKQIEAIVRQSGEIVAELRTDARGRVLADVRDPEDGRIWHMMELNVHGQLVPIVPAGF